MIISEINQSLVSLRQKGTFRECKILPRFKQDFSSNDYLSLSKSIRARLWLFYSVLRYGKSFCSSKYLNGYSKIHQKLEKTVAKAYNAQKGLIFSSGYLASIGTLQGIYNSETIIIADKYIHASWIDASFTVKARIVRYHHNDLNHLEEILKKYSFESNTLENNFKSKRLIIITESIFSMQGTVIDTQKYINLAEKYGAIIIVDNAHGLGVIKTYTNDYPLLLHVGTFSKACAGFGGYVCGNSTIISAIANFGRTQIYSTVLPEYIIAYNVYAFAFVLKNQGKMLNKAKKIAEKYHLEFKGSAILVKEFESIEEALIFQNALKQYGIFVPVVRPPTVPKPIVRFSICH